MGRKRRQHIQLEQVAISGIADKGRAVGKTEDGRVVFVEDVAPGDVVNVQTNRKKKGVFFGYPTHFHQYSLDRVEPFCPHFELCGGCKWQHITYEAQLRHKEEVVRNAIQRIGKVAVGELQPILPAIQTTYYRNKLEFSFSSKRWLTAQEIEAGVSNLEDVLGFHKAGAFDKIIDIEHCYLQPDPSNGLRNFIRVFAKENELAFYDARSHEGFLRNMVVRTSSTGDVMLILAIKKDEPDLYRPLLDAIVKAFPMVTSLYYCINPKVNDFLLDLEMVLYHGQPQIEDSLGEVRFQIGPKSFFQTNTLQAQRLYDTVVEFADFKGHENVYDLYTGIGSIALYVAQYCGQVIGIEEVAPAIDDARLNAQLNNNTNTRFYVGDVKDVLDDSFIAAHQRPDILITDPPRAGMHPKVVQVLLQLEAPKLVYVSCNPATQARDLQLLSEKYKIVKLRPVDMFPHTSHIESVALLELK
jgi:23S rRNA (uracil1939-C5)-methyltransferase